MPATSAPTAVREPLEILIVDDNAMDLVLVEEAHRSSGATSKLTKVAGGQQAVAYLHQRAQDSPNRAACLVLLDLNMPIWDGETTLQHIRRDSRIATTPVIMFTTSAAEADVERCYGVGANAYVVKPLSFEALTGFFAGIEAFWARFIVQPRQAPARTPRWL